MGPIQGYWWSIGAHTTIPPPTGVYPMASRYRSSTRVTDYLFPAIVILSLLFQY